MLNNLILIEEGKYRQFSNEKELVKYLLGNDYYSLSKKEKIRLMQLNAISKCYLTNMKVVTLLSKEGLTDIKNKFIVYDEKTFILSLLLVKKITLLERKESNFYTNNIDKTNIKDNYIIVNTFAETILKEYIND